MAKTLFYLRHYPPPFDGGAYNYNRHLVEELSQSGLEIIVMTHKDGVPVDTPTLKVYPIHSIKTGRYRYSTRSKQVCDIIASILEVKKFLARDKYEWIVTDAGYIQNLVIFLAAFPHHNRIIGINLSEEISSLQKTTKVRAMLQSWLLKKHVFNIVISKSTETMLRNLGVTSQVLLVYPCIEKQPLLRKSEERKRLTEKFGLQGKDLIVGFLGRHIQRKGVHNLILAVNELRHGGCQINLLIAGWGQESNSIQNLIDSMNCGLYCKMIGSLPEDEKSSFLCGVDIFAMPNFYDSQTGDSEGFGIVFLEAAQQGTPVIGGNDGGVPEAISDGFNGFVVDGNDTHSISEAIEKYYFNPDLRVLHGENGRVWVDGFNWHDQLKPLVDKITPS